MSNTKPPQKPKFPKTDRLAVAQTSPETMTAEVKDLSLAEFAAVTADVCSGLHSYLRAIEHGDGAKPLVTPHVLALQQLAVASTWLLREHANKKLASVNTQSVTECDRTKLH
ncbi:hypothetical protein ACVBEF_12895 [Glaciimonas sp. GG7]